ncbi:MAG: hypothetical protein FWF23_01965 [Alphaproteobacteria bacterium]|nr:hypothetical protein [Alphaproteobacteria bacterium]MCL2505674.1 hypothetical protein [Alphaproteobacteria bacterium]
MPIDVCQKFWEDAVDRFIDAAQNIKLIKSESETCWVRNTLLNTPLLFRHDLHKSRGYVTHKSGSDTATTMTLSIDLKNTMFRIPDCDDPNYRTPDNINTMKLLFHEFTHVLQPKPTIDRGHSDIEAAAAIVAEYAFHSYLEKHLNSNEYALKAFEDRYVYSDFEFNYSSPLCVKLSVKKLPPAASYLLEMGIYTKLMDILDINHIDFARSTLTYGIPEKEEISKKLASLTDDPQMYDKFISIADKAWQYGTRRASGYGIGDYGFDEDPEGNRAIFKSALKSITSVCEGGPLLPIDGLMTEEKIAAARKQMTDWILVDDDEPLLPIAGEDDYKKAEKNPEAEKTPDTVEEIVTEYGVTRTLDNSGKKNIAAALQEAMAKENFEQLPGVYDSLRANSFNTPRGRNEPVAKTDKTKANNKHGGYHNPMSG